MRQGRPVTYVLFILVATCSTAAADDLWSFILPEQRRLSIRHPEQFPRIPLPDVPPPVTVSRRPPDGATWKLGLDEAMQVALANADVVRVLAGVTATGSGSTIYDAAITNTSIDNARARFDPTIDVRDHFAKNESPSAIADPGVPSGVRIGGAGIESHDVTLGIGKTNVLGGRGQINIHTNRADSNLLGLPLNPSTSSSLELGYTQPLLSGAGVAANTAPIVIARIDTERSFFQFKDNVQQLVQSVIAGYWNLVFARTDLWAREQQVRQGQEALDLAEAKLRTGIGNVSDVAQARSALAGFEAGLVTAQANLLQREMALLNLMGIPPVQPPRIVPTTPPRLDKQEFSWPALLRIAEQYRPDLIELKLVIEADQQQLIIARNQARPVLDAAMLYRWNGLEGRTPDRLMVASRGGQFADWQLGVNFSVPLGLRQGRAALRQRELLYARDQANLRQGLHSATHQLALTLRNLDQFYEQYRSFQIAREAARQNLAAQSARYRTGLAILLNVLQAISDWGNFVSSEAQSLAQYNIELATLELQTGTILESHGIRFFEERYGSLGPLGPLCSCDAYVESLHPTPNTPRYSETDREAEAVFQLEEPLLRQRMGPRKPYGAEDVISPGGDGSAALPSEAAPESVLSLPPVER